MKIAETPSAPSQDYYAFVHQRTGAQVRVVGAENIAIYMAIKNRLSECIGVNFMDDKLEFWHVWQKQGLSIHGMDAINTFAANFKKNSDRFPELAHPSSYEIWRALEEKEPGLVVTFGAFLGCATVCTVTACIFALAFNSANTGY